MVAASIITLSLEICDDHQASVHRQNKRWNQENFPVFVSGKMWIIQLFELRGRSSNSRQVRRRDCLQLDRGLLGFEDTVLNSNGAATVANPLALPRQQVNLHYRLWGATHHGVCAVIFCAHHRLENPSRSMC